MKLAIFHAKIIFNMLSQNTTEMNEEFNNLIDKLESLNKGSNMGEATQKCLNSLKKLKTARRFAKIDEQIFKLGLNKIEADKSDFFTELLYLETKRLKFKEESTKCLENQKAIKIQMTSK
jgi:hypothetical protein